MNRSKMERNVVSPQGMNSFLWRQAEALAVSGALTVPVTVVTRHDDSKEVIVGYNLAKLAPAVA